MRALKNVVAVLAIGLALAAAAPAGDALPSSLPKGVTLGVSIRSASEFLDALDDFVAAISRDTGSDVPAGLVRDRAMMVLPLPKEIWERDLALYLLLERPNGIASLFSHALIVSGVGFDELREALEDGGFKVDLRRPDYAIITLSSRMPYFLSPAGDNRVVMSPNPIMLKITLNGLAEGWEPKHWGGGVLGAATDKPGELFGGKLSAKALAADLAALRRRVTADMKAGRGLPAGFDGDFLLAVLDTVEESLPGLAAEIAEVGWLGLDARLDGARLGLALEAASAPGSVVGRLAAGAAGRGNVDSPLARNVAAGAVAMILTAPPGEAFTGAMRAVIDFYDRLGARAFPDRKDGTVARFNKLLDCDFREIAIEERFREGVLSAACWMGTAEPAKVVDAYVSSFHGVNDVFAVAMPGPGKDAYVVHDDTTPGGTPAKRIEADPRFTVGMVELSSFLFGNSRPTPGLPAGFMDQSVLIAPGDGQVVIVTGKAGGEELDAALAASGGAKVPLWENRDVRWVVEDLARRQSALMLIDYSSMMTELMGMSLGGGNAPPGGPIAAEAFRKASPHFQRAKTMVGFAMGAADGRLVLDSVFPAETVNVIWRNIARINAESEKERAEGRKNAPGKKR